jgi:hypothetical protein
VRQLRDAQHVFAANFHERPAEDAGWQRD